LGLYFIHFILLAQHLPWASDSSFTRFLEFLNHTQRRTTASMALLDEWSDCRRDLWQHTTL